LGMKKTDSGLGKWLGVGLRVRDVAGSHAGCGRGDGRLLCEEVVIRVVLGS
jgi:hypothetical protein